MKSSENRERDSIAAPRSRKLQIVPVTLDEANEFVRQNHRHHKPVPGAKFCVAVAYDREDGADCEICGVAIVGRPIARMSDDGWTLEVNRTCTDERRMRTRLYTGLADVLRSPLAIGD